jgi:3-oxoadipate enol-lactonase
VFVKRFAGPPGAPTVVLLHGWTVTADLNWQASYRSLSRYFDVVAFDHHGHGRGVRAAERFRLEHCADDVAAVAAALDIERFIVAGYSMGGPIASLVWHRHRDLVDGLVMCATSRHFCDSPTRRAFFKVVGSGAHLSGHRQLRALGKLPATAWSRRLQRRGGSAGVIEQNLGHDWTRVLEAGTAIGRFDSRPWASSIDVPLAVVATLGDSVVPTQHQFELAEAVPGATVHRVPGGHTACSDRFGPFTSELLDACRSVSDRAARRNSDLVRSTLPESVAS